VGDHVIGKYGKGTVYVPYPTSNSVKLEKPEVGVLAQEGFESNKTFQVNSHQSLLVASLVALVLVSAGYIMVKCKRSEKHSQIREPLTDETITV